MSVNRSHFETLKTLASYLWVKERRDLRLRVVGAVACLLFAKVLNICVPFLYKYVVDALSIPNDSLVLPTFVILAYGGARVSAQMFGDLRDFIFVRVGAYAQRKIALETFDHLHQLSLAFHLSRQTGGLSRMIERGTRGVQSVLGFLLFNILPTILEIIFVAVVLALKFPPVFCIITVATIVAYIIYTFFISDWRIQFRQAMNQMDTDANAKAVDSLLNYETVKYFSNEPLEHARFNEALERYENASVKSQGTLSLLNIGQGTLIGIGLMMLMYFAGKGVVNRTMTLGDFVLLNTFLIQLYLPLNFLGFVYREIKQGLIDMEKMFDLLTNESDVRDIPGAKSLELNKGNIEFRNVVFGYSPDRTILKGISFSVPQGSTLAIVGPSGAGKSTISRLLFRFYDIQSGEILIDGQDISKVRQDSLRKVIGIVPQDTVLFNDTIGYNLRYGDANASQNEVEHAAQLAEIDEFIESLPLKYESPVGERGLKLSGGEKQRVAIARMMLKKPDLMLFDEATSALDSHTEKEIQRSLAKVSQGKTTLVIAHRLSTVVDADQIIVLQNGQIVERGTHRSLLAHKGQYAQMWQKQLEAQKEERVA